jgi:hypothetical protein
MSKLVREVVIEPAAVSDYRDFRYIFGKLGFSKGRLAIKVPKDWERLLLESCRDDIDRKRIAEALRKFGCRRLVEAPPTGSSRFKDWIGHVLAVHQRCQLERIVVAKPLAKTDPALPDVVCISDCSDENLPDIRELRVRRTSDVLVDVARLLFRNSARVVVVDPYFNILKRSCLDTLDKLIRVSREERCDNLWLITSEKWMPSGNINDEFGKRLSPFYGANRNRPTLKFIFLREALDGDDFHHRFIMSDFGAVRYDAGVAGESELQGNDVVLVDEARHEQLMARYYGNLEYFPDFIDWCWPPVARGYNLNR